jgi:adenylate kinase
LEVVASRLDDSDTCNGVLYDGFPRTIPQADGLLEWLQNHNRTIDGLICIDVPDDEVVGRLTKRRTCLDCGATYHLVFKPLKVAGSCDQCNGTNVVQRNDDQEDKVRQRLQDYHRWTAPIIQHLSGVSDVVSIDGIGDIKDISNRVSNQLKQWIQSKNSIT